MQKTLIGFLALATATLSVLCGVLWARLGAATERVRSAEQARGAEAEAREAQAARVKELERSEARLERQVQEFSKVTTTLRTSEAVQSSNLTRLTERVRAAGAKGSASSGESEGNFGKGMGEMLGKMMKDPAMREMMREQQKATINMMYSGLFKELNLTPDEKEKLKSLLTDVQMRSIEGVQGLFGGEDKSVAEDATKQMAAAKKQADEEIKALLGEQGFAQYEDYQKNIGERMQIDQFKTQLAGAHMPMRDEQAAQLMQIIKEEKAALPPVIPTDQTQMPKREFFTPEKIEEQGKWLEDFNRRVLARAPGVLTPEQIIEYQKFQEQQISMQKLGLNMARQMFGGKSADTAPR